MRIASLLAFVALASGTLASQEPVLIPAPFLAPKYVAPPDAPSSIVIAGKDEPGERFIVTGRMLAEGTPVAGASIYVFHADADGRYTRNGRNNDQNARQHGAMRSDANGRYRFETIRPKG